MITEVVLPLCACVFFRPSSCSQTLLLEKWRHSCQFLQRCELHFRWVKILSRFCCAGAHHLSRYCTWRTVNPRTESGQNLYRQYIGKKGKVVLDALWVHECVKAGALQTFVNNFAGCKVTGNEE